MRGPEDGHENGRVDGRVVAVAVAARPDVEGDVVGNSEGTSMDARGEAGPRPDAAVGTDSGLLDFYQHMLPVERRTFWACAAGWTLDGMDFMLYPLVIGTIIAQWGVQPAWAGTAVTATLLASAVGGWLAGLLADRIGRVRTLQITVAWFSFFSLLCAFAQDFDQLFAARALLGLGFGGEWAAGAVLVGETVRAQYRGRAVGSVQSGWAVGWGLAALGQAVLFSLMPPETAWRWMFALGTLPALLILYLRRAVPEPAVFARTRARQAAAGTAPGLLGIFDRSMLRTTVLACLVGTGAQGGYYAIATWVPRFLTTERGLGVVSSTGYLASLILGSFAGYLTGAWLADRIGRRSLFLVFSLGAIVVVLAYTQLPLSGGVLWLLGLPLGFFSTGAFSGLGPFFTELYPTHLRGSGQGFCYNFGRGIGALFPTLVGALSSGMSLANAIATFSVAAFCLFFLAAYCLPETRGKVLEAAA